MRDTPAFALELIGRIDVDGDALFTIELQGQTVAVVFPSVRQLVSFARLYNVAGSHLRMTQIPSLLKKSDLSLELRVKDAVIGRANGSMKGNWIAKILRLGPVQIDVLALLKSLR